MSTDPVIREVAYDDTLSPERRLEILDELYDGASEQDRAEIEGYVEMMCLIIDARRQPALA